jgi:hypothetical protein
MEKPAGDLPVDHQVDQVLSLWLLDGSPEKPELARCLLAALAKVALVEGEPQVPILEHEVVSGAVVATPVHRAS